MNRPRRAARSAVLGALCVAFVAACGVTSGTSDAVAGLALPANAGGRYLQEAGEQTAGVRSERVSIEMVVSDAEGEVLITTTGEGAFDRTTGVGELTTSVATGEPMGSFDLGTDLVYDGDDVYVKAGFLDFLTDGKPWVKLSSPRIGEFADELGGSVVADPGAWLELLQAAGTPLEDLGTETVRGVTTRHVATDLDVAALLEEAAPEQADELRGLLDDVPAVAEELAAVPTEVWIDSEGYVRKVSFTITHEGEEDDAAAGTTVTQTVELWDFDVPVEVSVPPADEVAEFDLAELLGD